MDKDYATYVLGGGSEAAAAQWLNLSTAYYKDLPERLHPVMTDRVYAAALRKGMASAMGITAKQYAQNSGAKALLESLLVRVSFAACIANLMDPVPPEFAGIGPEPSPGSKRAYHRQDGDKSSSTAAAQG